MNYALGKPRGGACFKMQVEGADGTVTKYMRKEELENAIWTPRFAQAGYTMSLVTMQYLRWCHRFWKAPTHTPDDFDKATKEILQECARIQMTISKDSVTTSISRDKWKAHWRRTKEGTLSSISGRHFGLTKQACAHLTLLTYRFFSQS